MKPTKWILLLMTACSALHAQAANEKQVVRRITLEEAITLARVQSVNAAVALNELKTAYWEYRTYKANLLPEVNFSATIPGYAKSYNSYQQGDGSYTFVRNNFMQMSGELSIDQNIWLTIILYNNSIHLREMTKNDKASFINNISRKRKSI